MNNTTKLLSRIGAGASVAVIAATLCLTAALPAYAGGIPPTAGPDFYSVTAGVPLSVSAANGILANDVDPEGDVIGINTLYSNNGGNLLPGEGLNVNPDGSFVYTPPVGFTGTRTWAYRPQDDVEVGPLVNIVFTITGSVQPPANTAPITVTDMYAVVKDVPITPVAPGVLVNDADADGDALSVVSQSLVGVPLAGEALTIAADGSFSYTPPTGFTGGREWRYVVSDGTALSAETSVLFTVSAAPTGNTAPTTLADYYPVTADVVLNVGDPGVLGNDSDDDGDAITVVAPSAPAGGSLPGEALSLDSDGSFHYVPPAGFTGTRTWTYTATDGTDTSLGANIVFTIAGVVAAANTAPIANPDAYDVIKDVSFSRLGAGYVENDTDADGDTLSWNIVVSPVGGLLPGENLTMLTDAGAFAYLPPTGFTGTRVFTYRADDATDVSNLATITFTVVPREALDEPDLPTESGDDPTGGTVPTGLASTGSTPSWMLGVLAAMVAATGFVLVRSSRRVA